MSLTNQSLLGVKITTSPKSIILEEVRKYLEKSKIQNPKSKSKSRKPLVIFTPNPEIVEFAQKDGTFRRIVNWAQINIPDGQGICWAVKKVHKTKISRISGTDFMLDLCRISLEESLTIGLIGGRGGVAVVTKECLQKKLPGLECWVMGDGELEINESRIKNPHFAKASRGRQESGIRNNKKNHSFHDSYFIIHDSTGKTIDTGKYFSDLVREIIKQKIDILFVALGFPKQEHFIKLLSDKAVKLSSDRPIVLMAVGGAFDYISGRVTRAPEVLRERGLEWLYRLLYEPGRWKRQLSGLQFFLRIIRNSIYR